MELIYNYSIAIKFFSANKLITCSIASYSPNLLDSNVLVDTRWRASRIRTQRTAFPIIIR